VVVPRADHRYFYLVSPAERMRTRKKKGRNEPATCCRNDEAAAKDKTFAPLRHGDTEEKDKWIPSDRWFICVSSQGGSSIFRPCVSSIEKEDTENKASTDLHCGLWNRRLCRRSTKPQTKQKSNPNLEMQRKRRSRGLLGL